MIVVLALVGGGIYLLTKSSPKPKTSTAPTTAPAPVSTTAPTTTAPPSTTTPPVTTNQPIWLISPGHLAALEQGGMSSSLATTLFNNPNTYFNFGANGAQVTESQISAQHAKFPLATMNYLFNSFGPNAKTGAAGIQGALPQGIPAGIGSIQYDPEGPANGTPIAEQQALEAGNLTYVTQAAALAHAHGLKFIFSPSIDVGMTKGEGGYPAKYATYLAQHRGAWAGVAGINIFCIQSQQAEGTPLFTSFVNSAVAQARAAAPTVAIVIGIGINPSTPATPITSQDLLAGQAVGRAANVAGYWNNVETNVGANVPASVYVTFFQDLENAGS